MIVQEIDEDSSVLVYSDIVNKEQFQPAVVRFDDSANIVHLVDTFLDKADREELWLTAEEYSFIRELNRTIADCVRTGCFVESSSHSARGLERFFDDHVRRRRKKGKAAALETQAWQLKTWGKPVNDGIALYYSMACKTSHQIALSVAQHDAMVASEGSKTLPIDFCQ